MRRTWLPVILFGLFLISPVPAQERPPNIVLVMADDLGYEILGCGDSSSYRTPELDRLGENGMRFEQCYATPLCTPSRVELMTGQYCFRDYAGWTTFNYQKTTFAHLLNRAGYQTCISGKWQLGKEKKGPRIAGFDEYFIKTSTEPKVTRDFWWKIGTVIDNGTRRDQFQEKFVADVFSNYLLDFIERNKQGPFFAYLSMFLPHDPFTPTPESADKGWKNVNGVKFSVKRGDPRYFGDMVAYVDYVIGRIVRKLESLGIRDQTLIIFTADNGTHPLIKTRCNGRIIQGGKGKMTDAGTRVPLIASWPGTIPAGSVSRDLVDFSDFLPTLVDVAGAQLPENQVVDGRSFLPQLKGRPGDPRDWVYCYYPKGGWNKTGLKRFVRSRNWKLHGDGRLFDLKSDPAERNPIKPGKGNPEAKQARARLNAAFEKLR